LAAIHLLVAEQQIEESAKNGENQDQDEPGNLIAWIAAVADDEKGDDDTDKQKEKIDCRIVIADIEDAQNDDRNLNGE
jgi:hypothetical protein